MIAATPWRAAVPRPQHSARSAVIMSNTEATKAVHVRLFASARAAAGVDSETLSLPTEATVQHVVAELARRHPDDLPRVLKAASFLVNGVAARESTTPLPDAAELDVLPPFAGG